MSPWMFLKLISVRPGVSGAKKMGCLVPSQQDGSKDPYPSPLSHTHTMVVWSFMFHIPTCCVEELKVTMYSNIPQIHSRGSITSQLRPFPPVCLSKTGPIVS